MSWKDEQREQHDALIEAVDGVRAALTPVETPRRVREPLGRRSVLRELPWLAVGLKLCVDRETGTTLAGLLRRVPDEYVHGKTVRCVCGETHELEPVVGCGCGRLFVGDESGLYAARIPADG